VSYDASTKDKRELLSDWVAIMRELRALDVIRTNNNPIGDIAEAIVCDHYKGERASFSQKGWDVKAPSGERIQVKSRRKTPESNPTVLSPISENEYDSLVVVMFNEDFQVTEGLKATRALIEDRFGLDGKNQRRVIVSRLRSDAEIEKVDLSAVSAWLAPILD
jgi:Lhr-like helicase